MTQSPDSPSQGTGVLLASNHPARSLVVRHGRVVSHWVDRHTYLLLTAPALVLLLLLVPYPVGFNLVSSFTNLSLQFPETSWIGITNYLTVFTDPQFYGSIVRSVVWTLASVAGQLLLGLVAALALQVVRAGQGPLRLALIIPWAFPSIAVAYSWRFMLDQQYGVLNDILMRLHLISQPVAWLGSPAAALPSVIVMNIWFGFPFMMVTLIAGLQTIPAEHYESAAVDGANYWQGLFLITLPQLRTLIGSLVILRTIWVFNNFDFIYLTTGGGPVNATETLPVFSFQIGWANYKVGQMSAVSVVSLLILAGITAIYFRLFGSAGEE